MKHRICSTGLNKNKKLNENRKKYDVRTGGYKGVQAVRLESVAGGAFCCTILVSNL